MIIYSNYGARMTLTNFKARSVLEMGKGENKGYFRNYCSLRPES